MPRKPRPSDDADSLREMAERAFQQLKQRAAAAPPTDSPLPRVGLFLEGRRGRVFLVPHPSDAQLRSWTKRIRSGERSDEVDALAHNVLDDFVCRQRRGDSQSKVTMKWLADCFASVLTDADPLDAFGLLPRPAHRVADMSLATDVAAWVWAAERRGLTRAMATAMACDTFHQDISNVRKLLKKAARLVFAGPDSAFESYFAKKRRALPDVQTGKK